MEYFRYHVVSNYPVEDGDDSPARRRAEIKEGGEGEDKVMKERAGWVGEGGRAAEEAAVRDNLTKTTMCKLNVN